MYYGNYKQLCEFLSKKEEIPALNPEYKPKIKNMFFTIIKNGEVLFNNEAATPEEIFDAEPPKELIEKFGEDEIESLTIKLKEGTKVVSLKDASQKEDDEAIDGVLVILK